MAKRVIYSTKYAAVHKRVSAVRGKATSQDCVSCAEDGLPTRARHWAQIHETDGTDPWADFVPLCQPCHWRYDGVGARRRGVPRTAAERAAISAGKRGKPTHRKTQDEKDRISAALKGRPSPMTGRKHSEETRARMRAAHARRLGR